MVTTGIKGKIRILPGDVVSRIAAGEVIERPAAVVKELIENSLDAGSRSITVEIRNGGLALIRVTDDGEGMSREDALRACDRHATSKLRSDQDLWSIRTMGFRGEALPSIAAVSFLRVATALRFAETGTEFQIRGGTIGMIAEAPPVVGTRIEVTELFHNQPARKKFLKSISTEFSHISRVVQQAATAWPSVHFRLTHDGQEVLNYPSVLSEGDRVGQVYRGSFLDQSIMVQGALPEARLTGLIVDPVHAKSSRIPQELFVNRRPDRNTTVLHAVMEGYGAFLAKGRQAQFVLFLDVDPDRLDVNVHPTKRDVRFLENAGIHQLVRRTVRHALSGSRLGGRTQEAPFAADSKGWSPTSAPVTTPFVAGGARPDNPPGVEEQLAFVSELAEPYRHVSPDEVVPLGQLNRTYLIVQIGGALAVLDQHTAHERILFERLCRAWSASSIVSQPLLVPHSVELLGSQAALLYRHQGELETLGLVIEPFGTTTVLIRSIPLGLGKIEPEGLLHDLLDDLIQWDQTAGIETRIRPVLASLACHGAVRAGRPMEPPEIKALVDDWRAEGEISTCPHGRRTSFQLSTDDLEHLFGRAGW